MYYAQIITLFTYSGTQYNPECLSYLLLTTIRYTLIDDMNHIHDTTTRPDKSSHTLLKYLL